MIETSFSVVIPARLASTRLPNKPLADIAGKPMVVRVAQRAAQSNANQVVVATDHISIFKACMEHGVNVVMTSINHKSGTERLAEAARKLNLPNDSLLINVQGDEPMLDPQLINRLAILLAKTKSPVASAACKIKHITDFMNPNIVKTILDASGNAIYFSRAPIPWPRDAFALNKNSLPEDFCALRHIGIYGYRVEFLHHYSKLSPSPIEKIEALEQLRILWHGYSIAVVLSDEKPLAGVDTLEDLERVRAYFSAQ